MFSLFKKKEQKPQASKSDVKKEKKTNANIAEVSEKSGWAYSEAKDKMKKAKVDFGISWKDYNRYDFYKIPIEMQEAEYRKIIEKRERKQKEKDDCINAVINALNCSQEEAINLVKDAKERLGITYKTYNKYKFYEIPVDNQEERYKQILKNKEDKKYCIDTVMNGCNCSKDDAKKIINEAKKRLGISYRTYAKYEFYNIPVENQEIKYQEILENARRKKEKKERKKLKNETLIHTVMDETGWDYETAKSKMKASKESSGADYKDYVAYKFWNMSDSEQKTYFTKGCANTLRKKYNTVKENVQFFMNKGMFNETFSEFLGREWSYNKEITLEEFEKTFKNTNKIIYKPLSASCGSGVTTFDLTKGFENAYNELVKLPIGVVEGFITQHKEMSKFSKNSVNTIRLVTVRENNNVNLLYGAFRMGGGDSIVDNFHSGGVLALIDVNNATVVTDAIDLNSNQYKYHPVTQEKIKGFVIPYWKEIIDMLNKAAKLVDGIGYIGWDIAITEQGPVLIEGNTAPAPNVLQLPYHLEGKGMRYVAEKFLAE